MLRMLLVPVAALCAFPALAESPGKTLFADATRCYARTYSADHLASHPVQQVTSIALTPEPESGAAGNLVLRLSITLRTGREVYFGAGYCDDAGAGQLACGMEGDAGTFYLAVAKDGAVLLTIGSNGVSFEGQTDFQTLDGRTGDDRSFLLRPTRACR